jgi:hypothetical protein
MIGLELLALRTGVEGVFAESSVIYAADGGFRLDHAWELTLGIGTPAWRGGDIAHTLRSPLI